MSLVFTRVTLFGGAKSRHKQGYTLPQPCCLWPVVFRHRFVSIMLGRKPHAVTVVQGVAGSRPAANHLMAALQQHDLFLYFGHGAAEQCLPLSALRRLDSCAAALLMGCSSGRLRSAGQYEAAGPVWSYLMAGRPSWHGMRAPKAHLLDNLSLTTLNLNPQPQTSAKTCPESDLSHPLPQQQPRVPTSFPLHFVQWFNPAVWLKPTCGKSMSRACPKKGCLG